MQDMPFLKAGILGFKAKWWHDSGLKVVMAVKILQMGKPVTMELHSGDYTVDQQNHYDLV